MTGPDSCANCGEPLGGRFCSACGQENRNLARIRVGQLLQEWLGDVFTFDSRLFRTLAPLVAKPGLLTREYLAGRRARYVPPLRLFIFVSLVMFLVLGFTGVQFSYRVTAGDEEIVAFGRHVDTAPAAAADEAAEASEAGPAEDSAAGEADGLDLLDDPDEVNRRILDRSPQAMFVLAPVFALFVWVLQRRRAPFYMSHLIFSLHVHSFWFLVVMASGLLDLPFPSQRPGKLLIALTFLPYLYLALRRVYGGGRLANLLRTAALGLAQLIAFFAVMLTLVMLTVLRT